HPTAAQIRNIVSRILAANHLGRLREQPLVDAAPLDDWSGSTGNSTGDKDGELWNPDLVEADPYASTSSSSPSSAPVMDGTPPGEWDVIVVNDKRFMNAYADIGLVVIGTGFLPICQNEQGLAAVLAHGTQHHRIESHLVAHHRAENISKISLYYCVAAWGIAFFGPIGLLASMTPWVLGLFSDASLSEAQEMEADFVGINLMARACYDPRAASEVLLRLARIEEDVRKKLPREEHARTHPLAMERARVLESRLRQGYTVMSSNPDCADALAQFRQAASSLRA
ncbi:peptidase family M48-domain-containing protein, partial [Schizophyllum fasciatum]